MSQCQRYSAQSLVDLFFFLFDVARKTGSTAPNVVFQRGNSKTAKEAKGKEAGRNPSPRTSPGVRPMERRDGPTDHRPISQPIGQWNNCVHNIRGVGNVMQIPAERPRRHSTRPRGRKQMLRYWGKQDRRKIVDVVRLGQ